MMAFPFAMGPLASQVGMSVAMQTVQSPIIARTACAVMGVGYPVYQSYKAIESKEAGDDAQWLTYWTVYGLLHLVETGVEDILKWIPFYYHVKLGFLIWLMLPNTEGAKQLYETVLRPVLIKYQPKVDTVIAWWQENVFYIYEQNRHAINLALTPVVMLGKSAWQFAVWFFMQQADPKQVEGDDDGSKPEDPPKQEKGK